MGILNIISRNFQHGPRTRRPDDVPPYPEAFRGTLAHNADRCTACGTCAYVCSPGAITFDSTNPHIVVWNYFEGQCTFCARCVDYCPTHAIQLKPSSPQVTTDESTEHLAHEIRQQICLRCGRSFIPLPKAVLDELYRDGASPALRTQSTLCEVCRRRAASERLIRKISARSE